MSAQFWLTGNTLALDQWNELLESWALEQQVELYDPPEFNDDVDHPIAFIWGEGSIRGVNLTYHVDACEMEVRIGALASRTDWVLAYSLLRAAMRNGGGILERTEGWSGTDLSEEQADCDAIDSFCAATRRKKRLPQNESNNAFMLSVGKLLIPCGRDEIPECTAESMPAVEAALAEKVARYGRAFRGPTLELPNGARIVSWSLTPTLIGNVEGVLIEPLKAIVPLDRLIDVLGDRACSLGDEAAYLPELDQERDRELLDRLSLEHVNTEVLAKRRGTHADDEDLTARIVRASVHAVIVSLIAGDESDDVRGRLVSAGLTNGMAEDMERLGRATLHGLVHERRPAEELRVELVQEGVPDAWAAAAVNAGAEALWDRSTRAPVGRKRSAESRRMPRSSEDKAIRVDDQSTEEPRSRTAGQGE